ncbi:MAG: metallophosphoesterase family protein [Candidatus Poseidoniaceae archaeon]|jgi:hypothetical protein|nr:metallophosphoesterase family protein [Candidatus Poseidoniaceae archaeon]
MKNSWLLAVALSLLMLPVVSSQGPGETFSECPGTLTGSSVPEQIHLQMTDIPNEMVVMWATDMRGDAYVEWSYGTNTQSAQGESYCYNHDIALHMATMTDLPLNENITYRVGDGSAWSTEWTFRTIDPASSNFEWISIADHGMSDEGQQVSDAIIYDESAQMVTISGDISYADGSQNVWDDWFNIQQPSMAKIPWVTAAGNHENEPGVGFIPYEHRFDSDKQIESEGFWYSRDLPGVHMIFISSEHDYSLGSEQYNWIKSDLEIANTETARESRPFIIVYCHKPMYSSNSYHGSEVELRDALEELYVANNVDLVIAGHDHFYERTYPVIEEKVVEKGPIHLVIGVGGRSSYEELDVPQPEWSAYRENSTYGWTKLVYDGDSRTIDFTHYRIDNSVGDKFTLQENLKNIEIKEDSSELGVSSINLIILLTALIGAARFIDQ